MDIFGIMKEQFTRGQDLAVNGYYSPGLRLHFLPTLQQYAHRTDVHHSVLKAHGKTNKDFQRSHSTGVYE